MVTLLFSLILPLLVEAAEVHLPRVQIVLGLLEAAAVLASLSPSQAPPPHMLGEVGVEARTPQAQGAQGEGGPVVP
jgi:hypothetical protein